MKESASSKTAQYMALFRAMETTRSASKRLFADKYAHLFLPPGLKVAARLSHLRAFRKMAENIIHKRIPGAYSSGIARTRLIDELLEEAVGKGARQVMILGAGFDTRGLRLPFLHGMPVIEIDHPNTARYKLSKLRAHHIPKHVRYYQIDFNRQSLDQLGAQHHFDFSLPTAFIWEGVTNYLTEEAIDSTFAFLQRFAAGSHVIFTYVHQEVLDNPAAFTGAEKLLKDVAGLEEKWTFGFDPAALAAYLQRFGFTLIKDLGADEYRALYLNGREKEEGYEFYRVAFARLTENR
ncbi:class I SAM-dependent methyltransferase [Chitinophaga qingshengii]|uniref:S-adenosyl-L-methionine-dependent methyltransferase n=1 Tax=Chitinophaga qingshengii TaxID=1569794 RepID=A0ABR7TS29_9BACT|nr:SAM-dependent methyltransferase [Chitinophaga qingshengii]MBC9933272.1 SAM-dependent methyltransferase [Chitinophaga qingshengii]